MNIYFTSDLHFGHTNIIKYSNRPFTSVHEMDEGLIENWNKTVNSNDVIWLIGDIFFSNAERAKEILLRLKGKKRLILGNHDKVIRNNKSVQDLFDKIYPDLHQEYINGDLVVMCHYPLLTWNKAHHGSFMLHGHCHNTIPYDPKYRRLDVGVDAQNYAPISFDEIKSKLGSALKGDVRDY